MSARSAELGLWIAAGALLVVAGLGAWRAALGATDARANALPSVAEATDRRGPMVETSEQITTGDPFRAQRHPSPMAYKPEFEGVAPPPPPPKPPHPALALAGILGGPPWEALLEGIPGHDGSTLVHQGQVLGTLRIRGITRDSVIVQGEDTTWRLALKRTWQ